MATKTPLTAAVATTPSTAAPETPPFRAAPVTIKFDIGRSGNDTINGGSGSDTITFDNSFGHGNADIEHHGNVTTIDFANTGQTMTVSNVEELVFTDKTIHI